MPLHRAIEDQGIENFSFEVIKTVEYIDTYHLLIYSFGEVIDNLGDVRFKISDLKFNHDPEFIITYQCSGRFYDRNLNECIDDDDDE